jgi:hypothetical protein
MTPVITIRRLDAQIPIARHYPDEPHPDNEHAWKSWWVRKCFDLQQPLTTGALKWIHQCWQTTKAGWNTEDVTRRANARGQRRAPTEKVERE